MPWEVTFDPSRPFAVKTLRISAVSLLRGIKVLVTRGGLNFLLMSRKKGPLCPNNENQRCIKRQVFDVFDTMTHVSFGRHFLVEKKTSKYLVCLFLFAYVLEISKLRKQLYLQ